MQGYTAWQVSAHVPYNDLRHIRSVQGFSAGV
jgi:hypothetical protein